MCVSQTQNHAQRSQPHGRQRPELIKCAQHIENRLTNLFHPMCGYEPYKFILPNVWIWVAARVLGGVPLAPRSLVPLEKQKETDRRRGKDRTLAVSCPI